MIAAVLVLAVAVPVVLAATIVARAKTEFMSRRGDQPTRVVLVAA